MRTKSNFLSNEKIACAGACAYLAVVSAIAWAWPRAAIWALDGEWYLVWALAIAAVVAWFGLAYQAIAASWSVLTCQRNTAGSRSLAVAIKPCLHIVYRTLVGSAGIFVAVTLTAAVTGTVMGLLLASGAAVAALAGISREAWTGAAVNAADAQAILTMVAPGTANLVLALTLACIATRLASKASFVALAGVGAGTCAVAFSLARVLTGAASGSGIEAFDLVLTAAGVLLFYAGTIQNRDAAPREIAATS